MRYVGGKGRIARQLATAIRANTQARIVHDPFMGGGAMTAALATEFDEVHAADGHEDVALMWQAILQGWEPGPVTFDEWQRLRESTTPSAERGFAGYGGSFGGRWFQGFARGGHMADGTPRNHQAESARAAIRDRDKMLAGQVTVTHADYSECSPAPGERAAIYCDPPYATSADSKLYAAPFDGAEFWRWAAERSREHDVFVSEYEAPDGWVPIWQAQKRQSLVIGSGSREFRTEYLFIYAPHLSWILEDD